MSVSEFTTVQIPLINPNEPEAILAQIHVVEGQKVKQGDILCTLETTKSTADVESEADGYVLGLKVQEGGSVNAGDILCYLASDPEWTPPEKEPSFSGLTSDHAGSPSSDPDIPTGMRITQPALRLARSHGLDLSQLPVDRLITESLVRAMMEEGKPGPEWPAPASAFDPTAIIIYGGGGHGKALIDLLRVLNAYRIIGILDDGLEPGNVIMGVPVLGGQDQLLQLYDRGVRQAINAVGGVGNVAVRILIFQRLLEAGFVCPPVIHPTAFVETSAVLSSGVQVMPHAYVGSQARLGFGTIVNTGAIISHDCHLEDFVNISPGAMLAGEVRVGAGSLVGMGATINLGVQIGAGSRIGNGSTVIKDVPDKGLVRAGTIWPAGQRRAP